MKDGGIIERLGLFPKGRERRAYEILGVHKEDATVIFRVFAPNANRAFVVGDFNSWLEEHPMEKISEDGFWQAKLPEREVREGDLYKFKFYTEKGQVYRSDPFGFGMDKPPHCASRVVSVEGYEWRDQGWMAQRKENAEADIYAQPLNIYEIHAPSWKKDQDGGSLSFRELARELAPYVKQMGYTHVELMPISEHPYGGSWGYQVGGYFAPTSRGGSPEELMGFVDIMHNAGIGVILDWVPAHFPKDEFGLSMFDGTTLFEYDDPARAAIRSWGTLRFDTGKGAVRSFLISNAIYWLEKYHFDGLRTDAVSSMIYLDCEASGDGGVPDNSRDNLVPEAIEFFKELNSTVKSEYPDVLMIAEESGALGGVTGDGGLGFDLKWNMGWMNDTLRYASADFHERKDLHDRLTFPLMYAFNEKYVLPISHDEVVYGKKSFLDKMPGDYWRKFAGARAFEALKMMMPGKKLTFMGCEIGQFREWRSEESVEWFLLDYESHARHQLYCADLNNFYLEHPELWRRDDGWEGFGWIEPDDAERSIISFVRRDGLGNELVIAINMTPATYNDHILPVFTEGEYREVFNSDSTAYGGSGVTNSGTVFKSFSSFEPLCGDKHENTIGQAIRLRLPPLGVTVLSRKK